VDYDAIYRAFIRLPADQQTRLIFELSNRLGVFLHREVSGEVRRRIQERGEAIDQRGGPLIGAHLAELGAPRRPAGETEQP